MTHASRSLQTLVRLRRGLERQEEMKLALASQRLATAELHLHTEHASQRRDRDATRRELEEGMYGAELSLAQQQVEVSTARSLRLQARVQELGHERAQQVESLLLRVRDRKALENLRQRRLAEVRVHQARQAQQETDDAFARQSMRVEPSAAVGRGAGAPASR